jgi:hypothetical protein
MNRTPQDIVSDAEIDRVHGFANFGDTSRREVVNEAVLKYAFGYTTGHTALRILTEHRLVKKPVGYETTLTKKGREYLRAMFRDVSLEAILNLTK